MTKRKVIMIFGSGRSGTTWIQDVIAKTENLSPLFEPLHPCVGVVSKKYANKYLIEDDKANDLQLFVASLVESKCPSTWIKYRSIPYRLIPCVETFKSIRNIYELLVRYKNYFKRKKEFNRDTSGVVIKFIRANLLIKWLVNKFEFDSILVLRHPCAVIESKIRLDKSAQASGLQHGASDWDPDVTIGEFLADIELKNKYILPYFSEASIKELCPVGKHALIWAIENKIAIESCSEKGIYICFYEQLVIDSDNEWKIVQTKLGMKNDVSSDLLSRPSQQASQDFNSQAALEDKLSRWKDRLSDVDKKVIQKVIEKYGLDMYSSHKNLPNKEAVLKAKGI